MNIPVLMYHGVSDEISKVPYGFLLQPTDQFEACMKYLCSHGFSTITLKDLYEHLRYKKPLPKKPIVLTFDDGYLDNWVYVYPILKKYGLKATIFVVPEFVDPTDACRPNLDDVNAGSVRRNDLKWWGYLSWTEMIAMEASGVIDIQSHTLTHTWYFKSDVLVDFHHPDDSYPWLAWNNFPERKYKWVDESQDGLVPYGTPVYEFGRSLGIRRYFDDAALRDHLTNFVQSKNGAFFDDPAWRRNLSDQVRVYTARHSLRGRYESEEEYNRRLHCEIVETKQTLETHLNKQIEFLCWPGGAHTPQADLIALRSGYLATTKGDRKNSPGTDPSRIHRTATYLDSRRFSPGILRAVALPLFVLEIQSYRGEPISSCLMHSALTLARTSKRLLPWLRWQPPAQRSRESGHSHPEYEQ